MIIVKKIKSNKIIPSSSTTICEYLMNELGISGAVAKISGRYPQHGFAINEISKELVYVLSGNGKIITPTKTIEFSHGDVIFIDKQEKFAWQGEFRIFMVTAPKLNPNQHKVFNK